MSDLLHVELNFASENNAPGAFEFPFVTRIATGESLYLTPHVVPVHDLRKDERRPSLEVEGLTWQTVPYEGLDGNDGWEERYAKETCEYVNAPSIDV